MRRTALFVDVMAALHGEVLTVTHLGRSITSEAKEKHCIKRGDRLHCNRRLQRERLSIYSTLTQLLLGTKQRPVIIVDWSDLDECAEPGNRPPRAPARPCVPRRSVRALPAPDEMPRVAKRNRTLYPCFVGEPIVIRCIR